MAIMSLESDLYADLCADAGLAALVGTRIYHGYRAQGATMPCVVYQRISTMPQYSQDGNSGLTQARVQCDCWASSAVNAITVADALKAAIEGRTLKRTTFIENELDDYEPDTRLWRRIVDLIIWQEAEI